jgi:hypothetical protein
MLTINKSYTGFNVSMPIAQSKRKLIAATALFIAVGALTGAIATGGATSISFAQTEEQAGGGGGAATGQQGGGEARILRQGVATSQQDPLPGHEEHQEITILPLRQLLLPHMAIHQFHQHQFHLQVMDFGFTH